MGKFKKSHLMDKLTDEFQISYNKNTLEDLTNPRMYYTYHVTYGLDMMRWQIDGRTDGQTDGHNSHNSMILWPVQIPD